MSNPTPKFYFETPSHHGYARVHITSQNFRPKRNGEQQHTATWHVKPRHRIVASSSGNERRARVTVCIRRFSQIDLSRWFNRPQVLVKSFEIFERKADARSHIEHEMGIYPHLSSFPDDHRICMSSLVFLSIIVHFLRPGHNCLWPIGLIRWREQTPRGEVNFVASEARQQNDGSIPSFYFDCFYKKK